MARGLAGLLQFYRRRPAAAAVVLCAAILGVLAGLFGYRLYGSIGQLRASVDQASAIIDATGQYVDAMRDAETSQRGYLLTMRPSYLEPFWNSSSVYDQAGARLEELTRRSPELQAETASLRLVGRQKMLELNETIRLAMRDGQQAALPEVLTDVGKAAMDSVRQHASRINEIALIERSAHTAKLIQEEQRILYAILLAAVIGVALLGAAALVLLLGRDRLVTVQRALQLQSERLRGTVEHIPEGVAVFDALDRLLLCNSAFCPIAGVPAGLCSPGTPFDRIAQAAEGWNPP
jgi:CHASE3 domain sensor protein